MATTLQFLKNKTQQVIRANLFKKEMCPPPSNRLFWWHVKFNNSFSTCLQKCYKFSPLNNREKNDHVTSLRLEVIIIGEVMIASDALCPGRLVWRSLRPQSLGYSASMNWWGSLPRFAANKFILLTCYSPTTSFQDHFPWHQLPSFTEVTVTLRDRWMHGRHKNIHNKRWVALSLWFVGVKWSLRLFAGAEIDEVTMNIF